MESPYTTQNRKKSHSQKPGIFHRLRASGGRGRSKGKLQLPPLFSQLLADSARANFDLSSLIFVRSVASCKSLFISAFVDFVPYVNPLSSLRSAYSTIAHFRQNFPSLKISAALGLCARFLLFPSRSLRPLREGSPHPTFGCGSAALCLGDSAREFPSQRSLRFMRKHLSAGRTAGKRVERYLPPILQLERHPGAL